MHYNPVHKGEWIHGTCDIISQPQTYINKELMEFLSSCNVVCYNDTSHGELYNTFRVIPVFPTIVWWSWNSCNQRILLSWLIIYIYTPGWCHVHGLRTMVFSISHFQLHWSKMCVACWLSNIRQKVSVSI